MSKYVGKNKEPLSLSDMLSGLSQSLAAQAEKPNLYGYKPNPGQQEEFHKSLAFGRVFIGGNQSGKTTGGVVEDLRWATKRHPHRRFDDHIKIAGRAIGVDLLKGIERILVPEFKRWVLPSDLVNGSWEDSWRPAPRAILNFANGSSIEFLTYEQSLEKHAGTKRHFIHFDEEPPQAIFGENMARLLAQDPAAWWITMTPVDGITWVDEVLVHPDVPAQDVDIFVVSSYENITLPEGSIARTFANLDEDEQKVRTEGAFIPKGGRVYPEFQVSVHAQVPTSWVPPADWTIWTSIDAGWNNPTCILYTAVSPNMDEIITFYEIYDNNRRVMDYAQEMHDFEKAQGLKVYNRVGDPAMKQVNMVSGTSVAMEFARCGIYMGLDSIPHSTSIGVEKIKQYLRTNPKTGKPFWQIVGTYCPKLVAQMKKLEWDYIQSAKLRDQRNKPETIKKKNDHAPDAIRYNFTCFPDLTDMQLSGAKVSQDLLVENDYIQTLINMSVAPPDAHPPIKRENRWRQIDNDDWDDWNVG